MKICWSLLRPPLCIIASNIAWYGVVKKTARTYGESFILIGNRLVAKMKFSCNHFHTIEMLNWTSIILLSRNKDYSILSPRLMFLLSTVLVGTHSWSIQNLFMLMCIVTNYTHMILPRLKIFRFPSSWSRITIKYQKVWKFTHRPADYSELYRSFSIIQPII